MAMPEAGAQHAAALAPVETYDAIDVERLGEVLIVVWELGDGGVSAQTTTGKHYVICPRDGGGLTIKSWNGCSHSEVLIADAIEPREEGEYRIGEEHSIEPTAVDDSRQRTRAATDGGTTAADVVRDATQGECLRIGIDDQECVVEVTDANATSPDADEWFDDPHQVVASADGYDVRLSTFTTATEGEPVHVEARRESMPDWEGWRALGPVDGLYRADGDDVGGVRELVE